MFKRILVAVDGSPTANQGLKTALALAADQRATMLLDNTCKLVNDPGSDARKLWSSI